MVQFSLALKRTMNDFKNSFFHNFLLIHTAKYIFSRDMFCLYHFRAKTHGVKWMAIDFATTIASPPIDPPSLSSFSSLFQAYWVVWDKVKPTSIHILGYVHVRLSTVGHMISTLRFLRTNYLSGLQKEALTFGQIFGKMY